MLYYYNCCYDKGRDEFYANVESVKDEVVFEIDDTKEMMNLIQDGIMDHVDDLAGLKAYLVHEGTINPTDVLKIGGFFLP